MFRTTYKAVLVVLCFLSFTTVSCEALLQKYINMQNEIENMQLGPGMKQTDRAYLKSVINEEIANLSVPGASDPATASKIATMLSTVVSSPDEMKQRYDLFKEYADKWSELTSTQLKVADERAYYSLLGEYTPRLKEIEGLLGFAVQPWYRRWLATARQHAVPIAGVTAAAVVTLGGLYVLDQRRKKQRKLAAAGLATTDDLSEELKEEKVENVGEKWEKFKALGPEEAAKTWEKLVTQKDPVVGKFVNHLHATPLSRAFLDLRLKWGPVRYTNFMKRLAQEERDKIMSHEKQIVDMLIDSQARGWKDFILLTPKHQLAVLGKMTKSAIRGGGPTDSFKQLIQGVSDTRIDLFLRDETVHKKVKELKAGIKDTDASPTPKKPDAAADERPTLSTDEKEETDYDRALFGDRESFFRLNENEQIAVLEKFRMGLQAFDPRGTNPNKQFQRLIEGATSETFKDLSAAVLKKLIEVKYKEDLPGIDGLVAPESPAPVRIPTAAAEREAEEREAEEREAELARQKQELAVEQHEERKDAESELVAELEPRAREGDWNAFYKLAITEKMDKTAAGVLDDLLQEGRFFKTYIKPEKQTPEVKKMLSNVTQEMVGSRAFGERAHFYTQTYTKLKKLHKKYPSLLPKVEYMLDGNYKHSEGRSSSDASSSASE